MAAIWNVDHHASHFETPDLGSVASVETAFLKRTTNATRYRADGNQGAVFDWCGPGDPLGLGWITAPIGRFAAVLEFVSADWNTYQRSVPS